MDGSPRGGWASDLTAMPLRLRSRRMFPITRTVEGVYTCDADRAVAQKIEEISYDEMLEMPRADPR